MSEFKIKVNVELDADDLKSKLEKLGGDNEINLKINTNKIEEQLKGLKKTFKDTFKLDGQVINDLNKIATALKKFDKSLGKPSNTQGRQINGLVKEYKELGNVVAKLEKQLNNGKLGADSVNRISSAIDELKKKMQTLRNIAEGSMDFNSLIKMDDFDHSQLNKGISEIHSNLNKVETQAESIRKTISNIDMSNISDGSKSELQDVLDIVERIKTEAKDVNLNMDTGAALRDLRDCEDTVKRISREAKSSSKGGIFSGIFGSFDDFKSNFAQFTFAEVAGDFIADGIRTMARGLKDTIVETDSAIVDLNKVYEKGLNGDNLKQYLNEFSEVAKQTGKSSIDVIQGTTKAIQSGIQDLDQALVFARQSSIFSNVGDIEQGEADTILTSIMSAYGGVENSLKPVREQIQGMGKDYSTLTKFMDLANHAGNNYAVTTADVGEALRQSASTLQAQGVSMEQSVGMAVALNEIMQDAGRTGTALKSMSTGMAGLTVSAKDGSIQLTKAGVAMKEVAGIDVWNEQTGELKSMYEVMDELSVKWGDLSEAEQTALGASIAGKTRITEFNALLSNWDTARKYVEDYNKGLTIGSAEKENLQYLDSINGKWNVIKENLKSIGNNLISSDFVKGALDGIGAITDAIAKLSATDFGGKLLGFTGLATGITAIAKAFSSLKNVFGAGRTLGTILDVADTADDITDIAVAGGGLTNTFKGLGAKIKNTVTSLGLFSSVGATAWTLLSAGAIGYIGYVVASDKAQTEASKKRIAESRELITNLEQEVRASQGVVDSVKNIAEEYDSLATKSNKTTQEQQRFAELTNQIAQTFPDLVSGYDSAGNPILELNGSLETYIANLERAIDKQKRLLDNEEDTLANELEKQMNKGQYLNDLFQTLQAYKQFTNPNNYGNLKSGSKKDLEEYIRSLKSTSKAEDDWYKERMEAVQNYEEAKNDVREKYRNKMEDSSYYKNTSDENKQEMQSVIDMLDLYGMGEESANKLVKSLVKLDDELVTSTEQMGEHAKGINNLEKEYANGSKNLNQYTDGMIDFYENAEKIDVESFGNLVNSIKSYADTTGDLEGANAQIAKLSEHMGELTGLDSSIWEQALKINVEPLEVAQQKLDNFLRTYGTGSQHLGKGGLADKLEKEFQVMRDLPMEFAQEALENGGTISAEFALEATVDAGTSIQEAVKGLLANDNLIDEQELTVLMKVISEIENEGEISAETEQLLRDVLPDEIEDEVISKIRVEADIQGEQEVDAFLQKIKLNETVEQEIRAHVNGKEEVEGLYNAIENLPTDKQLNAVSNFGKVKDEAHQLGVSLEGIPTETLVNIVANMDDAQIENFVQALSQVDGKTVSAFLQTEGAMEALQQCETVQQILDLINGKKTIAEIEAENNAEEEVKKINQSLDEIDGKNVTADLLVETDDGNLEQTKSALVEVDGRTYLAVVNVDTNETELVPFEGKLNEIDGKTVTATATANTTGEEKVQSLDNALQTLPKSTTSTVNANVSGEGDVESVGKTIERLPSTKEIVVSVVQSGTNLIDSIANWINSKAEQNVEIKAKVGKVDTSALNAIKAQTIDVSAKVTGLDQVNSLKSSLSSIQNKTVSITASGNALAQVNQIKTALSGIQSKSISISAGGNALGQINSIKSALAGLQSKTVSVTAIANGMGNVNALKASIAGLQGKSVSVSASTSGTGEVNALTSAIGRVQGKSVRVVANVSGTSAVKALTSAINKVKSKSVKISASVSGTGAVKSLASAIANVRSKTVRVNVNRNVTTTTQTVGASVNEASYTPSPASLLTSDIVSASNGIAPIDVPVTATAKSGISNLSNILPSIDFDVDLFKNLEEALKNLEAQLNVIDGKMEGAFGQEKVKLLQQQIPLLREQQKIQEQIVQDERKVNSEVSKWLNSQGFTFNNLGEITNYSDKLLAMERNVDSLKKKYDALNDVEKKNESAVKSAKDAYDKANDTLSKAKDYLDSYFDTNNTSILEATEKWYDYENQIKEVQDAIKELEKELKELNIDSGYKNIERDIAEVQNKLDMNDILLDRAEGEESIKLLEERIELIQQLQKETKDLEDYERQLRSGLMSELSQYGFSFRDDGSIVEYSQKIEKLKKSLSEEEFNNVFEKIEEYIKKTTETIPNLVLEYEKFNNEILDSKENIKDVYDELAKAEEEAREKAEEARKEAQRLAREIEKVRVDSLYDTYENRLTNIQGQLDVIDAELNKANGTERIDLLREQISLTEKLKKETQSMLNFQNSRRNTLMGELSKYGIGFANDGTMTGLSEAMANARRSLDDDDFNALNEKVQEYLNLCDSIPGVEADWVNLNDTIVDCRDEIEELERQMQLLYNENQVQSLTSQFEQLATELDMISNKIEFAYGADKIKLMADSIKLMNEQLSLQSDIIHSTKKQSDIYQYDLRKYGFNFDDGGNITNLSEQMDLFKNTDSFEKVNKLVEEYFDIQGELQGVIKDYSDLENAIKDAYKQQLDITKDIEGKITDVIEKEHEKRKKEVEDYTDARIGLLKEEQDAYRKLREEQNYEKTMQNQLDEVDALRKQIEIAKRDTSISGEKRLAELTKELAEAEKELAEVTQEKIDKDYEGNIDSEIEKLEKEQDMLLKSLEEQFSEVNIGKMVANALTTGIIEINGEVQTLQDILINSINDSVEGYSVMSDVIKNELVSNLNVALETMRQIEDIGEVLGLQNYNVLGSFPIELAGTPSYNGNGHTITVGDTHLVINGSVSDDIISDIEELINQKNNEMLNKITSSL